MYMLYRISRTYIYECLQFLFGFIHVKMVKPIHITVRVNSISPGWSDTNFETYEDNYSYFSKNTSGRIAGTLDEAKSFVFLVTM